jgi:hypothetical protein
MTLTITYNPNVLRVRTVQEGSFMTQGGIQAGFSQRIDAAAGRVDIAITRTADKTGASGTGLLAALLFDAVGPGGSRTGQWCGQRARWQRRSAAVQLADRDGTVRTVKW